MQSRNQSTSKVHISTWNKKPPSIQILKKPINFSKVHIIVDMHLVQVGIHIHPNHIKNKAKELGITAFVNYKSKLHFIACLIACIQAPTWAKFFWRKFNYTTLKLHKILNIHYIPLLPILLIFNDCIFKWKSIHGVMILSKHLDNQIKMNCPSIFELRFHKR